MEDARKGSKKSLFLILLSYVFPKTRLCQPTQAIFIFQYGSTEFRFLLKERSPHPEHIKMECWRAHSLISDVITPGKSNFSLGKQKQNKTDCCLSLSVSYRKGIMS